MSYRREISPGVTSPTDIPAEADGPYLLEVLRNPRKKTLIQTPAYKRHVPPSKCDDIFPKVPVIMCKTAEQLHSLDLRRFCLHQRNPVTIIRGGCKAINFDFEHFTTRSLVKKAPHQAIEIRKQIAQNSDFNIHNGKISWTCHSPRDWMPLKDYAAYQARSFVACNGHANPNQMRYGEKIDFGTNLDLSDESVWGDALAELNKLPVWLRVKQKENLLNHVGQKVLGVNTVQVYLKVPGARTPGHQENLCLCAVNINIGPGDTSWLGCPEEYWPMLDDLCKKNRTDYLEDPWWPSLEELIEAEIPIHRYVQRPGDIVFLNSGTPHWVQADGWCNNIAWNVFPAEKFQFDIAMERYQLNLQRSFQSLVPMERVAWNLANSGIEVDFSLFGSIRFYLQRSIFRVVSTLKRLKQMKIPVIQQTDDEQLRFCEKCNRELLILLWISDSTDGDQPSTPFCEECALSQSPSNWVVIQQFTVKKLQVMYDRLKLRL